MGQPTGSKKLKIRFVHSIGDGNNNKVSGDCKESSLLTVDKAKELEKKISKVR